MFMAATPASPGLSNGAIAGIVIGVLAGVALIAALVYFLYVRKTRGADDQRLHTENKPSASNHSKDQSENSSNKIEEVVYSYLDFDDQKHREKQIAVSPGTTATGVIYSIVKNN
ncbi:carcinoembryonic antigen-related cell adhesion molecule 1-like [Suncus etruscus]|uniref:carcinoembryonic antigen-related cell adhesion molecule 1-like n=1 Tax=Suncus etruscus TaxID=109475 RepID=UPI00211077A3|nr:carcinoembryonic antigen-related cell adhesion molecule 1-like [Suncus etruscus]